MGTEHNNINANDRYKGYTSFHDMHSGANEVNTTAKICNDKIQKSLRVLYHPYVFPIVTF